jgi:chemosensory pili system protein ChpA (sensor histidine kinase/response regulator)
MRLEDDIGFTTLNWVKAELDEALTQARQMLESYVAEPDDGRLMRDCAARLHQVQGTLRMVELYGAATVVQEMEHLVEALIDDKVEQRDDAYTALMRGLVQMPDYLERLQSGHRDIPIVLLPLLNELRSSRGVGPLHESALFTPNLEEPLPADVPGASPPLPRETQAQKVTALRVRFQQPLLAWFRGRGGRENLAAMRDTLDAIAGCCHTLAARRLWWITAGVLDGLERGVLDAYGTEVKQLIGRVDRFIKALIEQGESALVQDDVEDLVRTLLYYVAMAEPGSERLQALNHTYRLGQLLAREEEVEHAQGAMAGHNRALLDTVAQAIKEDLLRVKDGLDLFLRKTAGDPSELLPQIDVLERVADTLGMLGLNVPRRVVGEQCRVVQDITNRVHAPDEDTLLDVAGALLYVEASLDDHIARLGAEGTSQAATDSDESRMLPRTEARQVLEALMREAVDNLGRVKEAVVAFIESPWDHGHLDSAPRLLEEIAGALRVLDEERPTLLMEGIARFIDNELVHEQRVPTVEQMDKLADALASIEYYLEAAREHRGGLSHILDVTEHSLTELGYWPVPPRRVPEPSDQIEPEAVDSSAAVPEQEDTPVPVDTALTESVSVAPGEGLEDLVIGTAEQTPPVGEDVSGLRLADTVSASDEEKASAGEDWVEIEEEVEEEVPVPDAMAASAGFQNTADELDAEIREVFLEEVQEEIEGLQSKLEQWSKQRDSIDQLTAIRRAFHTLKGSGRLVGAEVLGEFAWKIENMLNRVLDHTIESHEGVEAVVRHAVDALPQLLAALNDEGVPTAPLEAIVETADRIAAGESDARVEQFASGRTERVKRIVKRRVPRAESTQTAEEVPTATLAGVSAEPMPTETEATDEADLGLSIPVLPPMDPVLLEILRSEIT